MKYEIEFETLAQRVSSGLKEFSERLENGDSLPATTIIGGERVNCRIVLRRDTPMPDRLRRRLWGVIPGGYWVAWNPNGRCYWFTRKPHIENDGQWKVNGELGQILPPGIARPIDVPKRYSAMQMPMEPPGDSELKAAAKEVVFKHDGSWMCQEPKQSDVINRLRKAIG